MKRISIQRQIFRDDLPARVLTELDEVRRLELGGGTLIRWLEAPHERHRINPPDEGETRSSVGSAEVIRFLCSD